MATWRNLQSKTDDFNRVLPSFDKENEELIDTVNVAVTAKAPDSKFDFKVKKQGDNVDAAFAAKVVLPKYENTEIGFQYKNKPEAAITLRITEGFLPIAGGFLEFKLGGSKKEEIFGADFGCKILGSDLNLGITVPLPTKIYDFVGDSEEANKSISEKTIQVHGDFLYRPILDRDVYIGADVTVDAPKDDGDVKYNGKFVAAIRNTTFEGGIQVSSDNATGKTDEYGDPKVVNKVGIWANSSKDNVILSSRFSKTLNTKDGFNGMEITTGMGTTSLDGSKFLTQLSIVPDNVISFGYEKVLSDSTTFSIGYSHVLAFGASSQKKKSSAYSFGLQINH